jgi:hypothetical protein
MDIHHIDGGGGHQDRARRRAPLAGVFSPAIDSGFGEAIMDVFVLILLIVAAVCFGLAAFNIVARLNLIALGLLASVLAMLLSAVEQLG